MKLDSKKIERVRSLLRDARKLIANKKRWCQGYFAVDKNGHEVEASDSEAAQFCALGAIKKVGKQRHFKDDTVSLAENLLNLACEDRFGTFDAPEVNDKGFDEESAFYGINPKSNNKTIEKAHKNVLEAFTLAVKKADLTTAKELA